MSSSSAHFRVRPSLPIPLFPSAYNDAGRHSLFSPFFFPQTVFLSSSSPKPLRSARTRLGRIWPTGNVAQPSLEAERLCKILLGPCACAACQPSQSAPETLRPSPSQPLFPPRVLHSSPRIPTLQTPALGLGGGAKGGARRGRGPSYRLSKTFFYLSGI